MVPTQISAFENLFFRQIWIYQWVWLLIGELLIRNIQGHLQVLTRRPRNHSVLIRDSRPFVFVFHLRLDIVLVLLVNLAIIAETDNEFVFPICEVDHLLILELLVLGNSLSSLLRCDIILVLQFVHIPLPLLVVIIVLVVLLPGEVE